MAQAQRLKEVREGDDVAVCCGGEAVDPGVPRAGVVDLKALVGAPGGKDLDLEGGVLADGAGFQMESAVSGERMSVMPK